MDDLEEKQAEDDAEEVLDLDAEGFDEQYLDTLEQALTEEEEEEEEMDMDSSRPKCTETELKQA